MLEIIAFTPKLTHLPSLALTSYETGLAIVSIYCELGSEATLGQHELLQPVKEQSSLR